MSVNKGFFRNTAIMFIAMFIVKFLGAVFKIPLGNILGGEGMGYFTTAFSIFTPVLAFTCSGIPAIITQVTAQKLSKGEFADIIHLRRSALFLGAVGGIIGTAVIYIAAVPFTCYIANSPESLLSVMIIAPSVFFCSVTAVYRGYFEGLSDMLPTAVSQIIEAVVKAAVGIGLSYYVYGLCVHRFGSEEQALPYAAAAAIFGVTASELSGMLYIFLRSRRDDIGYKGCCKKGFRDIRDTSAEILKQSLPVAVGAVVSNLMSFTDLLTISNCINLSYHFFPDQLAGGVVPMSMLDEGGDPGNFLYGSYSGMVISVYMLTATLPMLIARCSLPRLVCTIELNRNDNIFAIVKDINIMLKGTLLIAAPISLFMAVFSEPVLNILYPVRELEAALGIVPLRILSIGGFFAAFEGALLSVFQAYGDFKTPVSATLFGGFFKFLFNVVFLLIPGVNIIGAAAATTVSNALASVYVVKKLKKKYSLDIKAYRTAYPSLISASVSSLCGFFMYNAFITRFVPLLSLIFAVGAGGIMYFLILFIVDSRELAEIFAVLRNKKCSKVL